MGFRAPRFFSLFWRRPRRASGGSSGKAMCDGKIPAGKIAKAI